jgi:hypothetical protein
MVEGMSDAAIAEQMFVKMPTIKMHQKHLRWKLEVDSGAEVVSKAVREGLVENHTIVRQIEFAPEHFQAGVAILSYFGTVLRQKLPTTQATVRLEQQGFSVRLVIVTPDNDDEVIEKTLSDYGLVMSGRMLPSEYLSESNHIMQLENKLELANLELRLGQKQLDFEREGYRNRITGLDEEVRWLRERMGLLLIDGGNESAIEALKSILKDFHTQ